MLNILLAIFLSLFFAGCAPRENKEPEEAIRTPELKVTPEVVPSFKEDIAKAQAEEKNGNLLAARSVYKEIFAGLTDPQSIDSVKNKIEELNIKILFSKNLEEDSFLYEVEKGDSLDKISKKFNTTIELIKKANGLVSDMIMVGDKLKVTKAKFSVVVDKSQNILFLKRNDAIFKTYIVSTGKDNSTPVGTFKIVTKVENPPWFRRDIGAVVPPDSPENILGSRWLGLDVEGYGIHGTIKPNDLGKQETSGCVRMRNEEVEEVFAILPRGTEVTIVD
ncbi:MAG: L,D-transpeptidase family protein [Candidatus Omnitrophica bacterium]|nr:L,D-transpeptidase family protein [Candidatus Omnitrophota bacterium]